jgi:hypothetical protein
MTVIARHSKSWADLGACQQRAEPRGSIASTRIAGVRRLPRQTPATRTTPGGCESSILSPPSTASRFKSSMATPPVGRWCISVAGAAGRKREKKESPRSTPRGGYMGPYKPEAQASESKPKHALALRACNVRLSPPASSDSAARARAGASAAARAKDSLACTSCKKGWQHSQRADDVTYHHSVRPRSVKPGRNHRRQGLAGDVPGPAPLDRYQIVVGR